MTYTKAPQNKYASAQLQKINEHPDYIDLPIIHFSPGLILAGFETYAGIIAKAAEYHKKFRARRFTINGQEYQIFKVFAAGEYIKIKVFEVEQSSVQVETSDNKT